MAPQIEPSCIKIEVKNEVYLKWPKTRGPMNQVKIKTKGFGPTGGKPPGHLAKAKWAQKLRTRYEDKVAGYPTRPGPRGPANLGPTQLVAPN